MSLPHGSCEFLRGADMKYLIILLLCVATFFAILFMWYTLDVVYLNCVKWLG